MYRKTIEIRWLFFLIFSALLVWLACARATFAKVDIVVTSVAKQAIILAADSGQVLWQKNHESQMPPSSMSKLMTALIVFEQLEKKHLTFNQLVYISPKAWRIGKEGSRMFLEPKTQVSVEDLLDGLLAVSGNDAAVALAEEIAGDEAAFAKIMNEKVLDLGLKQSHFTNASGLPDPNHYMSAADLAMLMNTIIRRYPGYYKRFLNTPKYTHNNIEQYNKNKMLRSKYHGQFDGGKTGFSKSGGHGITLSGVSDGMRLILVINGLDGEAQREREAYRLMSWAFRYYRQVELDHDDPQLRILLPVYNGAEPDVSGRPYDNLTVVVPSESRHITVLLTPARPYLQPPTLAGDSIGTITLEGYHLTETIVADSNVATANWWKRSIFWLKKTVFGQEPSLATPKQVMISLPARG